MVVATSNNRLSTQEKNCILRMEFISVFYESQNEKRLLENFFLLYTLISNQETVHCFLWANGLFFIGDDLGLSPVTHP
jgi:hypothetical protein